MNIKHELGDCLNDKQIQVALLLDKLSDEERSDLFYFYCVFCGRKLYREPKDINGCNCMRDD